VIKFDEWYLPNGERHLQKWMQQVNDKVDGRLTYQMYKYRPSMQFVKQRRTAIDIGAHVGLWSYWMARDFQKLIAFEPMPEHAACWKENMKTRPNADLYQIALGDREGPAKVKTRTPGSSGDTGVDPDAELSSLRASIDDDGTVVQMKTLDSFELDEVDFIKADCEGFELFVMRGAEQTLRRNKPCIIIEQKPETGLAQRYKIGVTDGVKFLESLGAIRRKTIQGDYILSWA